MVQDVTLPQVVAEVAALRARFDRDEIFVEGIHSAVDTNALILSEVLARLTALETRADTTETIVNKVATDAESNDAARDAKLRDELNTVTTRLGDEIRADLLKVDESIGKLQAVAQAAAASAASASPTGTPDPSVVQLNGRVEVLTETVQKMIAEYAIFAQNFGVCSTQVNALVGAVGALQDLTRAQYSGPATGTSAEAENPRAAAGANTDPLWPNGGWPTRPAGGIPATARQFNMAGADSGGSDGGVGGQPTGGLFGGGGAEEARRR